MSLLGKILAIANVVAALIFFILATLDLGASRKPAYAAFQHDLAIEGLPIDDQDTDEAGRVRVYDLGDKTLATHFGTAGGQPVKTQLAEVERVKNLLKGQVDRAENSDAKVKALSRALIPLARTADRREALIRLRDGRDVGARQMAALANGRWNDFYQKVEQKLDGENKLPAGPDKKDEREAAVLKALDADPSLKPLKLQTVADWLPNDFNQAFDRVTKKDTVGGKPRDPEEWRQAIAHLLLQLTEPLAQAEAPADDKGPPPQPLDSRAYKRTVAVVGLKAAVREAEAQAVAWQQLAADVAKEIERDREAFIDRQQQWLVLLSEFAQEVQRQDFLLQKLNALKAEHDKHVNERRAEVKKTTDLIAQEQDNTRKLLREQAALEKAIVEEQTRLRDAFRNIQALERKVQQMEEALKTGKAP